MNLGHDSQMKVIRRGSLKLHINGFVQVVTSVYFIPMLKNDLLSIRQLQHLGLIVIFKAFRKEKGLLLASRMASNKFFPFIASAISPSCLKTCEDETYLLQIWSDCMVGKQYSEAIPRKTTWRSSKRLELIHSDMCEPITRESSNKMRFTFSFIDDYTRKLGCIFWQRSLMQQFVLRILKLKENQ